MVRLKLPPRARERATGADPGSSIWQTMLDNEALQREQQEEDEASAAALQAEENARVAAQAGPSAAQAGPSAALTTRVRNVFEDAIVEVQAPMPPVVPPSPPVGVPQSPQSPAGMPVLSVVPKPYESARRLVCRDPETMKNPNTWDSFHFHVKALGTARRERRKRHPRGIWPNTDRRSKTAETKANDQMKKYRKEINDLGRDPTPEEWRKKEQQVINRIMPARYVSDTLPDYKCQARDLTQDEREQLAADRNMIRDLRAREDGDHHRFDFSSKWGVSELQSLAVVIGPPTYYNKRGENDTLVLHNSLFLEYEDFMDEERRDILSTIRRATARLGRTEVSTEELEEQERLDALAEYAPLFEDEERDDLFVSKRQVVAASGPDNDGKKRQIFECRNTPVTNFDDPDAKDMQKEITRDGPDETKKRDEAAMQWVYDRVPLVDEKTGKVVKSGKKGAATPKHGRGSILYKEVEDLMELTNCAPCKEWNLDLERTAPGNGYYQAMQRVLEVKNQMGSQGSNASANNWRYYNTFVQDPLIRYFEGDGVSGSEKTYMLDALVRKHNPKTATSSGKRTYNSTLLHTELLRCYPEKMPSDSDRLNSILEFVCWFHDNNNKRAEADPLAQKKRGGTSDDLVKKLQDSFIYRALCCPNCKGQQHENEEDSMFGLREAVHQRVQALRIYMIMLKHALDEDVLRKGQGESVLWNYMATTDPQANQAAQGVYTDWEKLNTL